jgi:very-short-patch-repair endonuclease
MSRFNSTPAKTKRAKELRKDMPSAEMKLWREISRRQLGGFKFRRQHPAGAYFLDFYCPEIKLCIELDGDQHSDAHEQKRDARRTVFLNEHGIEVIRFWNNEVYDSIESVLEAILDQASYLKIEVELNRDGIPSP